MIDLHLHLDLDSRRRKMAANTLKCFLPMTGFLDTEIAPAIKLIPPNKGQNVHAKYRLNGWIYSSSLLKLYLSYSEIMILKILNT